MIRWWVIAFLVYSIVMFLAVVVWFNRERIKGKYYQIRWPERVIGCIIHYPGSSLYKRYWRLLPVKKVLYLDGVKYFYQPEAVVRESDLFLQETEGGYTASIDGAQYNILEHYFIKGKERIWPEIHFIYNRPMPIDFEDMISSDGSILVSAKELKELQDNDMAMGLLRYNSTTTLMVIVVLLCLVSCLIGLFNLAKLMGWLK